MRRRPLQLVFRRRGDVLREPLLAASDAGSDIAEELDGEGEHGEIANEADDADEAEEIIDAGFASLDSEQDLPPELGSAFQEEEDSFAFRLALAEGQESLALEAGSDGSESDELAIDSDEDDEEDGDEDDPGDEGEEDDGEDSLGPSLALGALPVYRLTAQDVRDMTPERSECPICLEDYAVGELQITLPCFHRFHDHCAMQWLRRSTCCPSCKFSLSGNALWTLDV